MATISTYASYLTVNRDLKSSLSTVANQSSVAKDTAYYKENIGKVTTVDEFLGDYKLYSYAMKAYGLEDMTYGKAFMRKVLESDLTDSSSFANSLTDKRYVQFAEAFNFAGDKKVAQNSAQSTSLTDAYSASFAAEEKSLKDDATYFASKIGTFTSVDDLLKNSRLQTYMLDAVGLDSEFVSKSYLKQVLTSDLDDENSVANQAKNKAWKTLAEAFNFNADGTLDTGVSAQTADQTEDLKLGYIFKKSTFNSDTLAEANNRYFEKNVAKVTTATELVSDSRMLAYVKTAFGLNSIMLPSSVASLMSSESFATNYGNTALLDKFNFQTDGTLANGDTPQTATQTSDVAKLYDTAFSADQSTASDAAVANYKTRISSFENIDDFFVSNKKDKDQKNNDVTEVWDVALRAFGIDPDEVSASELKRVLTSDVSDKKSYVNSLKDERFVELNKAFNFTADGQLKAPVLAQSEAMTDKLADDYKASQLRTLSGQAKKTATTKADTEIEYYTEQMKSIKTVADLLADSRLTDFMLVGSGIDPKSVETADLKKMFASDLSDPKSFVNTQENGAFAELVGSFNFDAKGELNPETVSGGQQRGALLETTNQYFRQTLEEQQGESNAGVRLAMYFERMAPTITSAYSFLSDDALFQFFKTSFSLPSTIANMDVTKQAEMVNKFVDLKQLQDPDYVSKLLKRFTALYDVQNNTASSPSLSILTSSSGTSISADTLLAVAQLSAR
ncbi:flagellar protein [Rhizobium sp. Leaf262]|nr:flagellar protein [Rhizobium sp. Leaf262]